MKALLEAKLPISAVISNRPQAHGLSVAQQHGVATATVDHQQYPDRESFDSALAAAIDRFSPQLIVLAGFMRILTENFVARYAGRMINIHPSLLPAFPGLHTHRRALESGALVHGCTVHFVTADLDHGPVIAQAAVAVHAGDNEDSLAGRVLEQEHILLPQAVRWFLEGKLHVHGMRVQVSDVSITHAALRVPNL